MMPRLKLCLHVLTCVLTTLGCWMDGAAVPRQQVLVEHFTNASCGPCADNNPALHAAMNAMTRDTVIKISVHTWWPGFTDPFYQWNTADCNARISYYGISGVPTCVRQP